MENLLDFSLPSIPDPKHSFQWAIAKNASAFYLSQLKKENPALPFCILTDTAQNARALLTALAFFAPQYQTHFLPDSETLPYDLFSAHADLNAQKIKTLWMLANHQVDFLILSAPSALQRFAPPAFLLKNSFVLKVGDCLQLGNFRKRLQEVGYNATHQVLSVGEYAIRGSLLDIFPSGSPYPLRIDFLDNEVESIRFFDTETQRTLNQEKEVAILPAFEFPSDEAAFSFFRENFRKRFDSIDSPIYKSISKGFVPAGIEYYLPLFFNETACLFDYLPENTVFFHTPETFHQMTLFLKEVHERFHSIGNFEPERLLLKPEEIYFQANDFFKKGENFSSICLKEVPHVLPDIQINHQFQNPLKNFQQFKNENPQANILLFADSLGRQEIILNLFKHHHFDLKTFSTFQQWQQQALALTVAPLEKGFALKIHGQPHFFFTENELYQNKRPFHQKRKQTHIDSYFKDLTELKIGDAVVHKRHGVGRYAGLVKLNENQEEFLKLTYANQACLLVPVSQLDVISRYGGQNADSAPLNTLGNDQWEKTKKRAQQQASDVAAELLLLYAKRSSQKGHAFSFDSIAYARFAAGFDFTETPDQAAAIEAVLNDLQNNKPMDRLICGDVGFGKTEVALRAAFCAALSGKQVAVLCPTTLLCQQHYQSFLARFLPLNNDYPIHIAQLSRFNNSKENLAILSGLQNGTVDIVIGTHKLISNNVQFKNLGLLIIDEEHRFGVKQKEKLKTLRANVDILTLTATPIPRTLSMSMEGLRDFSIIASAPEKRLSIKTFVSKNHASVIREAILRELKRGGQVYFVHNDVKSIDDALRRLEKLLPQANIVVGHGQMPKTQLERVMRDFSAQRADVLLSSTIIETGIDNPHANTILIENAENFGLAQLHQLRGRVGRSHHQAYAYLLIDDEKTLNKQARQRLDAIASSEELGAGFYLAMQDLEIRGAGEILGAAQSGEMNEVGFEMYHKMLQNAIAQLKNEPSEPIENQEINLHLPAFLPENYCPDIHARLQLYKRLAHAKTLEELEQLKEELIDRFGLLPDSAQNLIATHHWRIFVRALPIVKLDASGQFIRAEFAPQLENSAIDPAHLIFLIQNNRHFQLQNPNKLRFQMDSHNLNERNHALNQFFNYLLKK